MLVVLALAYVGYVAVRALRRLVGEVRDSGAHRGRVSGSVPAWSSPPARGDVAPVPYTVPGAFVAQHGVVELVFLDRADTDAVAPGQRVELTRNGIALHPEVGSATVAEGAGRLAGRTALGVLPAPARWPRPGAARDQLPPRHGRAPDDATGGARVDAGERPLWEAAYRRVPPARSSTDRRRP